MSIRTSLFILPTLMLAGFANVSHAQEIPTTAEDAKQSSAVIQTEKDSMMPTPKVIVFDVNETLLDLAGLKKSVGEALNGREDLLPLWFSNMLHYSLVETLSGEYHDFGEIGAAALMMVAEREGIELD